jgi:hypothetical protein
LFIVNVIHVQQKCLVGSWLLVVVVYDHQHNNKSEACLERTQKYKQKRDKGTNKRLAAAISGIPLSCKICTQNNKTTPS